MCEGWGYEISGIDIYSACSSAMKAADARGYGAEIATHIATVTWPFPFVYNFCRQVDPRIAADRTHGIPSGLIHS
jgi:hypothetical protein